MEVRPGTIDAIVSNMKDSDMYRNAVLQISKFGKMKQNDAKIRYTVTMSDGARSVRGIFSSALSAQIESGILKENMLVKLGVFNVRQKDNSLYVLVNTLLATEECDRVIGASVASERREKENMGNNQRESPKKFKETETSCIPIKTLNPFLNNWTVKGRVVEKTGIKKFNTKNGEGKVFSFEIIDHTQQCKVACFNQAVDQFYPLIEEGKVLKLAQGVVKMANKNYSNNNFDYEIHLEEKSTVELVEDDTMPRYCFNFKKISEIGMESATVDLVGVIKEVYPKQTITTKNTNKELDKRDVIVVDETGQIRITLWGEKADDELEKDKIAVFTKLRTNEYNGISLNSTAGSGILMDHDCKEAVELTAWFDRDGKNLVVEKPKTARRRTFISHILDNNMEFGTIAGIVDFVKEDALFYTSCPSEGCSKKVMQEDNGEYRCEKCNEVFSDCNYRYMATLCLSDCTGQVWATAFDNIGVKLFGMSAKEMNGLRESNAEEVSALVKRVVGKEFAIKLRLKDTIYNDAVSKRINVVELEPVDKKQAAKQMLEAMGKITSD